MKISSSFISGNVDNLCPETSNRQKDIKATVSKDGCDTFCSMRVTSNFSDKKQANENCIKRIYMNFRNFLSKLSSTTNDERTSTKSCDISKIDKIVDPNNTGKATRLPSLSELEKFGVSTDVPEYLYHLTSKENYQSMLASGKLKQGFDHYCGSAVFAFDFNNFNKNWNNILDSDVNMKDKLLKQAAKFGDDVVLLKIPTKFLDKGKMFVRSENAFFKVSESDLYDKREIQKFVLTPENRLLIETGKTTFGDLFLKRSRDLVLKNETPLTASHFLGEIPVEYANLLDCKGEAVEYLYREDIPISFVSKLGEIKLSDYSEMSVKERVEQAYSKLFQAEV